MVFVSVKRGERILSISLGVGLLLATIGCGTRAASSQAGRHAAIGRPTDVAKHFIVLVSEDDDTHRDSQGLPVKHDSLVLGEPLDAVREASNASTKASAEAFKFKNGSFNIGVAWDRAPMGARCLDVSVERHNDPQQLPDFRASGCVPTSGPSARVAKIDRASGGSIEVIVWFFDGPAAQLPPPSLPESSGGPLPGNGTEI